MMAAPAITLRAASVALAMVLAMAPAAAAPPAAAPGAPPARPAAPPAAAPAQAVPGPPNALQGFSQNREEPVSIESNSFELNDKAKVATFVGDVQVTQGDTTLRCARLLVFYDQGGTPGTLTAAKPGPGGQQQIRRLEARGGIVVTQKEQIATGDTGIFDMKANTITMSGKVVITQGQNILRGDKLIVDMTTGMSRVESNPSSAGGARRGQVEGLILPGSAPDPTQAGKAAPGAPAAASPAPQGGARNPGRDAPKPTSSSAKVN
jgi:lipopolysaccharide export system protein LptA